MNVRVNTTAGSGVIGAASSEDPGRSARPVRAPADRGGGSQGGGSGSADGGVRDRVAELERILGDVTACLSRTGTAAILLDEQLRIRWFAPATAEFLGIGMHDQGRPITELGGFGGDDELCAAARAVRDGSSARTIERRDADGRWRQWRFLAGKTSGDGRVVAVSISDVTERRAAQAQQRFLAAELQHRVRNVLASIRSIVHRTFHDSESLDAFVASFDERIGALGRAENLIVSGSVAEVDLHTLVLDELQAHAAQLDGNAFVDGPDVRLTLRAAQILALALNEMTTNSVRFGALVSPEGQISVNWRLTEDGAPAHLVLTWDEAHVPMVAFARTDGFGMDLIQHGLPYSLGGTSRVEFGSDGIRWELDVPLTEGVGRPGDGASDPGGRNPG